MDPWQPCSVPSPASNPITATDININSKANTDVVDLAGLHNNEKNQADEHQDLFPLDDISDEPKDSSQSGSKELEELSFGDNFQPFEKLPDSQEYLDSLERKLKNIQKGGRNGPTAESILKSLGQTKESCMLKLLSNSVEKLTIEGEIYEDLKVNPLLKKLAPERQALTAEELVHLLKADQLEIILGGSNNNEEEAPTTSSSATTAPIESTTSELNSTSGTGESEQPSGETEKDRDNTENLTSSSDPPEKQD